LACGFQWILEIILIVECGGWGFGDFFGVELAFFMGVCLGLRIGPLSYS